MPSSAIKPNILILVKLSIIMLSVGIKPTVLIDVKLSAVMLGVINAKFCN
jgi:hypothetical protein